MPPMQKKAMKAMKKKGQKQEEKQKKAMKAMKKQQKGQKQKKKKQQNKAMGKMKKQQEYEVLFTLCHRCRRGQEIIECNNAGMLCFAEYYCQGCGGPLTICSCVVSA